MPTLYGDVEVVARSSADQGWLTCQKHLCKMWQALDAAEECLTSLHALSLGFRTGSLLRGTLMTSDIRLEASSDKFVCSFKAWSISYA